MVRHFFDALAELMAAEVPLVTVTVVDTMGSVPQDRGAKMIVLISDGDDQDPYSEEAAKAARGFHICWNLFMLA